MKRPMLCWVIMFALGEVAVRYGSVWLAGCVAVTIGLVVTAIPFLYITQNRRWLYIGVLCFVLGAVVCGYEQYKQQICSIEDGSTLTFYGIVTDELENANGQQYQISVRQLQNIRMRVRILINSEETFVIGDRIEGIGQVDNFETATNPGGFDERNYQLGKGNMFRLDKVEIRARKSGIFPVKAMLYRIRQRITEVYGQLFSEVDASLAGAMVLGDRANLDADIKQLYQRNGIAHLIAISGLHIAMLGGTVYQLLRKRLGSYPVAAGLGMLFILLYGTMAGLSGATLRAVIMLIVSIGADVAGRKYDSLTATAAALFLMLFAHPYQLNQASFLLSFGAVVGIAVVKPALSIRFEKVPRMLEGLLVSVSVQLVLLPVMLYFFYEVPVYSVLLNLIVVPLMSILLFFLIVAALAGNVMLSVGMIAALPAKIIFACYQVLCEWSERLPAHTICTGRPGLAWIVGYYVVLAAVVWLGYRQRYKLQIQVCVLLAGLFLLFYLPGSLQICMFDVGQGDGIYVKLPTRENILIDGGSSSKKKVGAYVLKNGIKYYGGATLDYVFVSHSDSDHYSGITELLEEPTITIRHLVLPDITNPDEAYERLVTTAQRQGIEIVYMKEGDKLSFGKVTFTCLNPEQRSYEDKNQSSIVLYMQYKRFDALFTGDMDEEVEQRIVGKLPARVAVLKVAHHGSATASSEAFLQQVSFQTALVSVGERNRYGHPAQVVMERLSQYCERIYLTKEAGGITIDSNGEQYFIHTVK